MMHSASVNDDFYAVRFFTAGAAGRREGIYMYIYIYTAAICDKKSVIFS